jgi:hypothetical protein
MTCLSVVVILRACELIDQDPPQTEPIVVMLRVRIFSSQEA